MSEIGEVVLSKHYDHATGRHLVHIDRADPRALVAGELMRDIVVDDCEPYATVTSERPLLAITFADDYGQRFVYRVGAYDREADAYEIQWPD